MSEQSAKPYLIRATCEWCADNGLTPYIAVKVNSATRRLTIDNEAVQFTARFSGASQEVSVPVSAIAGVFAKESGYGFAFTVPSDPVTSLHAATAPIEAPVGDATTSEKKPRERPKHLQVVK